MSSETISIKYFSPDTPTIKKIEQGDWIDLYAAHTVKIFEGDYALIRLGVAMKLPSGYEAYVAPRSSTFKKWGIIQANSIGIIDESYCGPNDEWMYPVIAMRDTVIEKGDKICQFRIQKKQPSIEFNVVEDLEDSNRGGFGSTGSK